MIKHLLQECYSEQMEIVSPCLCNLDRLQKCYFC
jgi:hypothetical protein